MTYSINIIGTIRRKENFNLIINIKTDFKQNKEQNLEKNYKNIRKKWQNYYCDF